MSEDVKDFLEELREYYNGGVPGLYPAESIVKKFVDYVEQLQRENADLRAINEGHRILNLDLRKENNDLKEEIERNKITIECYRKKFRETVKDNRDFVCKLNVYVEFENWLVENYYLNIPDVAKNSIVKEIYDKLQELKRSDNIEKTKN